MEVLFAKKIIELYGGLSGKPCLTTKSTLFSGYLSLASLVSRNSSQWDIPMFGSFAIFHESGHVPA